MVLQLLVVLIFWISSGAVEGWKWRYANGKPDNNPIISWNTYSLWRCVAFAAVLSMPVAFSSLPTFIFAHAIGWMVYERTFSIVRHDDILADRGLFHIVRNVWVLRPPPAIEALLAVMGIALYVLLAASY